MEQTTSQNSLDSLDGCVRREDRWAASFYDRYAPHIDALVGSLAQNFPHRKRAVAALGLAHDSTVLDIGCGVGLSFKTIESHISNKGVLVGIDVSSESLRHARRRALRNNWRNIHLVNVRIEDYRPAVEFDAALCTFALEIVQNYERAIDNIFDILRPGGSYVMIGMKLPSHMPSAWLNPLVERVWKRAGVDTGRDLRSYINSKPWSVEVLEECFCGFYYILRTKKR